MRCSDPAPHVAPHIARMSGKATLPRHNGELVFDSPWEGRVFGIVVTMHERGIFEWSDFQQQLIAEIRDWELKHPDGQGFRYYECWERALERLVFANDLAGREEFWTELEHAAVHDHLGHDDE